MKRNSNHLSEQDKQLISGAVTAGARDYFRERRQAIQPFVDQHFSLAGARRIHRNALGGDLLRAPANLMWAMPYVCLRLSGGMLRWAGAGKLADRMQRIPPGFRTRVQREVEWLVHTELLQLPFQQDDRIHEQDALLGAILAQPDLTQLFIEYLENIHHQSLKPGFLDTLISELTQYAGTRVAAADLACGIISLASGAALFGKMTPGSISTGTALATAIAHQSAVSGFFLGPSLGAFYYSIFPVSASAGLVLASTGGVLAALGVVSAVSGVVTDPVQRKLGLHQRRLNKFVDGLEQRFFVETDQGFNPKDHYVARVFDLFDMLKTASHIF